MTLILVDRQRILSENTLAKQIVVDKAAFSEYNDTHKKLNRQSNNNNGKKKYKNDSHKTIIAKLTTYLSEFYKSETYTK